MNWGTKVYVVFCLFLKMFTSKAVPDENWKSETDTTQEKEYKTNCFLSNSLRNFFNSGDEYVHEILLKV